MQIKGIEAAGLLSKGNDVRMTFDGLDISFQIPEKNLRLSMKMTENEMEPAMEQKNSEIVVVQNGDKVQTGDITPMVGMVVLAVCSMAFCVMELLRRIKY